MSKTRDCCDDCGQSFDRVPWGPMLNDRVWAKLAEKREVLCGPCMFARAKQRNIQLRLSSLRPCRMNLSFSSWGWFNLFAVAETKRSQREWLCRTVVRGRQTRLPPY
jgi:hypothetical protein